MQSRRAARCGLEFTTAAASGSHAVAAGSPGARGVALEHHGRPGSWAEGQVLPGAMLRWQEDGVYYLYVCGSDLGRAGLESGGAVRTGVATSKDLRSWTLAPDPVLDLGAVGAWGSSGSRGPTTRK